MKKLLTLFFLLFASSALAQEVGYFVRTDCGTLTPVANQTFCLQSTTTGGRTAGTAYVWDGGSWIASTAAAGTGHQIEDEGSAVTQRDVINFVGGGVSAADVGAKTTVTVAGPNLLLTGGTLTGQLVTDNLGIEFEESDTNPACAAGNYNIYADLSEATFKKCVNGVVTDLSAAGVTSVALTAPTQFSITGSPVTTSGTLAIAWATQTANFGLFGPTSGGAAVPTFRAMVKDDTPATTVHEDQSNTYTTGDQNFAGATTLTIPANSGCGAENTDGRICRDTDDNTAHIVVGGTNETLVYQSTLNDLSIGSLQDLNTDALPTVYPCFESGAGAPPAAGVNRAGCLYFDTTNSFLYAGYAAGGNYIDPGGQSDGYISLTDLTNTANATGGESLILVTDENLPVTSYAIDLVLPTATAGTPGGPFTNQPANDSIEIVSSSASDINPDSCVVIGNTNGADKTEMVRETILLNGTTPVASVKTNWGQIVHVDCSSFTPVGTITVRENSGDLTITQMNATYPKASVADGFITKPGGGAATTINTLHTFTPNQGEPPAASFCTIGARNAHPVQNCATGESVSFTSVLNRSYSGGSVIVDIHYAMASAVANNVEFTTAFERIGAEVQDLDADGFAAGIPSSDNAVPGTSGHVKVVSITHTTGAQMDSLAVGEAFRLKVQRSTPTGADAAGDAQIVAVVIRQ